jgi:hypothetical protein
MDIISVALELRTFTFSVLIYWFWQFIQFMKLRDWIQLAQVRGKWRALCEHDNENSDFIKCGRLHD